MYTILPNISGTINRYRVKFKWDETCQKAFETLKSCLVNAPILAYCYPGEDYDLILDADASDDAIGGLLSIRKRFPNESDAEIESRLVKPQQDATFDQGDDSDTLGDKYDIPGRERVVSYYSQAFNRQQKSYCTSRKELIAIVKTCERFSYFLKGRPRFYIRSDHKALIWLLSMRNPAPHKQITFVSMSL